MATTCNGHICWREQKRAKNRYTYERYLLVIVDFPFIFSSSSSMQCEQNGKEKREKGRFPFFLFPHMDECPCLAHNLTNGLSLGGDKQLTTAFQFQSFIVLCIAFILRRFVVVFSRMSHTLHQSDNQMVRTTKQFIIPRKFVGKW